MTQTAEQLIAQFQLAPLAEGGFFRRVYESNVTNTKGRRSGAAIYYLLQAPDYSCFHRIDCDELWHFYVGEPLLLHQINPAGEHTQILLGNPIITRGATPMAVVTSGTWFAAELASNTGYCLVGCTTTPEFLYETYDICDADTLKQQFPHHAAIIKRLTKS